jgi:hypothetical protein
MNVLANMSLAQRLYLLSAILIAALGGVAVVAWFSLGSAAGQVDSVGSMRAPQLERISSVELDVTRDAGEVTVGPLGHAERHSRQAQAHRGHAG